VKPTDEEEPVVAVIKEERLGLDIHWHHVVVVFPIIEGYQSAVSKIFNSKPMLRL
jgi:hypothetical protein